MIFIYFTLLSLSSFLQTRKATLSMDFDLEFHDCENGKPLPEIDTSDFEIIPQPNGSLTLNGSFRFLKDYNHPISWNIYTKRQERGEWIPAIVSRNIPNLCPVLQMPHEPWYAFTRNMLRKHCPFKAGHVERANNINVKNLATSFNVPADFIGEWRVYNSITSTRNGKSVEECVMLPVSIMEV